jgi:hypothetical protein
MRKLFAAAALAAVCACGSRVTPPQCEEIAERCHEPATSANATAEQRECHESAESKWTAGDCFTYHTRCFTACPAADGGR